MRRLLCLCFMLCCGPTALAGAPVFVGQQTPLAQSLPLKKIDHAVWDGLLRKYVDAAGLVNYRSWKASGPDSQALAAYLQHLSRAAFSLQTNRAEQLAFWINAYNAVTLQGILREYPTTSIRNHTAKLFGYNIWHDLQLYVGQQAYSLDHIEHQILRKMSEPRIHFAIVCASLGCPPLRQEAYWPDRIDDQLTQNARAFFQDAAKFRYDPARQIVYLSPILDWFGKDFGASPAERLRRIAPLLPSAAQAGALHPATQVRFLDYDWNLNQQALE